MDRFSIYKMHIETAWDKPNLNVMKSAIHYVVLLTVVMIYIADQVNQINQSIS